MRKWISFLCLASVLVACSPAHPPAQTPEPTLAEWTATPASTTTPVSQPSSTPLPSPTVIPVPPEKMLADFPLALGAIWEYSATIEYWDGAQTDYTNTWEGTVTLTVIDRQTNPDGGIVFTLQRDMSPKPSDLLWTQPGTFDYTVSGNGIFRDSRVKVYQYPLSDRADWLAFADYDYKVRVTSVKEVNPPYGKLNNCYQILISTNPDHSIDTFCPGIGIVSHEYIHHGTTQNEHFELVSYTPGQVD